MKELELVKGEQKFTSRDIAGWTGKRHDNIVRDIENELSALKAGNMEEYGNLNFEVSSYKHDTNTKDYKQYLLTKNGVQQLAMRYDAVVRAKINIKLEELKKLQTPQTFAQALRLAAELEEQKELALAERDEAIRTKAQISDTKTATAVGRIGGLVKSNNQLRAEVGFTKTYATVKKVEIATNRKFRWKPLKDYSKNNEYEVTKVLDVNYGQVNAYHSDVWYAVYDIDLSQLVSDDM